MQLIDADSGAALTNTEIATERINGQGVIGKTDADGWLELNLPPGDYALSTWQVEPLRSATLRWTAVGPSEDRLELHVPG